MASPSPLPARLGAGVSVRERMRRKQKRRRGGFPLSLFETFAGLALGCPSREWPFNDDPAYSAASGIIHSTWSICGIGGRRETRPSVGKRKKGVILAQADVRPGYSACRVTHDDVAGANRFAAELLHAEALGFRIATVTATSRLLSYVHGYFFSALARPWGLPSSPRLAGAASFVDAALATSGFAVSALAGLSAASASSRPSCRRSTRSSGSCAADDDRLATIVVPAALLEDGDLVAFACATISARQSVPAVDFRSDPSPASRTSVRSMLSPASPASFSTTILSRGQRDTAATRAHDSEHGPYHFP